LRLGGYDPYAPLIMPETTTSEPATNVAVYGLPITQLADSEAANGTLYYSKDRNSLIYRDETGTKFQIATFLVES
jgi:hypothetical protein